MSDSDSKIEGEDSEREAVDSASSDIDDSGSEREGSKNDEGTRSNQTNIKATFRKLTDDAQKFVGYIENHDDSQNSNAELSRNVDQGHRLVDTLEMDTSEAAIILEHSLVVAKAVKVYEKTCGRTGMNHFTIDKFLKAIKVKAMRSPGAGPTQRQYEEGKMHELLTNVRSVHSCTAREPIINLLGVITISGPLDVASSTTTTENKKSKRASAKARFDETNLEQHEVVNSQVGGSQNEKDNPLEQSAMKARKIKEICHEKHENDMSLVDYGLYGHGLDKKVETPRGFLQHVFDAAVITRDGYAEVTFPAFKNKTDPKIPKKMVTISNCQTSIRAEKPPQAATPDSYDLHRFQQIISFNSGTVKNLLRNQSQSKNVKPGQEGFLCQTDDGDETPTTSCLTRRK